jgi:hypothetical protein
MEPEDFAQQLERAFVELVSKRADARGYKKGEFAHILWPKLNENLASTRWTTIRCQASRTGKPQNVTLADAQRMADALGEDLGYLLAVAKEKVKDRLRLRKEGEKK